MSAAAAFVDLPAGAIEGDRVVVMPRVVRAHPAPAWWRAERGL